MIYLGLPEEYADYKKAAVVILPIPFEKTTTYQKGAAYGPQAIITASQEVELFDIETQTEMYKQGIATLPPVVAESSDEMLARGYEAAKKLIDDKKFVVSLGGEHTVSIGPIKAHLARWPQATILQLDAHSDTRESYQDSKYNHACVMARVKELTNNIIQVGIRSMDASESLDPSRVFYAHNIVRSDNWQEAIVNALNEHVYVTIDLDVFDPAYAPAVGTPEPGGLNWYQIIGLLRKVIKQRVLIGLDVVELKPEKDNVVSDFLAAKLVYKILSYWNISGHGAVGSARAWGA